VLTTDRRDHKPHRYEPIEAFALLTNDDLDLALTYDYNLAPASPGPVLETVALWSVPWGLGVPADTPDGPADYADRTWIVNSRNTADEDAVRTLASLAGSAPRIAHEIDSVACRFSTFNEGRCTSAPGVKIQ
jgi:DNA-binding transcriptional LysR family regulator